MKFQFKSRWSGNVIFEIEIRDDVPEERRTITALQKAVESGANLLGANLRGANLLGANLRGANLEDANLEDANLEDANLLGANLRGANLEDANLRGANLLGANLEDANLEDANLLGANLEDANLEDANLEDANLEDANLEDANLRGANLLGANLRGANLLGANLRGANLEDANLEDANLEPIKKDFIVEILKLPNEIPFLRQALLDGKIDGSTYNGDCACLAGTLAKACHADDVHNMPNNYVADAHSPRESFFLAIRPGDNPENNSAAKIALQWIDEALTMIENIRKAA
ncbi:Pentapeptide repeat [uncultured Caudovirales phage]|uniref:Pentapeptide repeat n=1 Tax=uncultured Caudovirales phage TaxID=2100421 RepID=A0A6J5M7K9_9CAUD|nr:Pentapeptide repeat [uncultured Caudovirales phage]